MHRVPRRKIKPFVLKKEPDTFISELKPIKSSAQQKALAKKMHHEYPLIPEIAILVIIRTACEVLRELLIKGCILSITKFFNDFKLYVFLQPRLGKKNPAARVSITTNKDLKNAKNE
jgi:hypothetical protein